MPVPTRDSARETLRQVGWLRRYSPELAERLVIEGRLVDRAAGEWAQAEGDDRGGLFIVIEGLLHSYCAAPGDREVMIGLIGPGAVLGHATRFSGGPRLVTAVCSRPSVLLELTEAALDRVAAGHPELWRAIADFTYANMRSVLQMAAELMVLGPRQRIAARLLAAARGAGEKAASDRDGADSPVVPLTQELLGELAGLSRKTVNAHLAALEREGLVEVTYGRIRLCRPGLLQAVAEG